ncbi:hypothetical protein L218DRAFT_912087 [Marasmius fiardii PR-910]|nr:hypothetical protein L218DRAFT_912087 [Marasmius fiardii PR-910]
MSDASASTSVPQDAVTDLVHGKLIFTATLHEMRDAILDLSLYATPCRYRFIDGEAFLKEQKLNLYEFGESTGSLSKSGDSPHPPHVSYAAISYTWHGNAINTDDPSSPLYWKDIKGTFQVKGAEDGDPISLDVLEHVCTTTERSSRYLWLDRLCIMQTSKPDKIWQITRMYMIYAHCKMCCVLPGGVRRLVRLQERTSWIDRGWTLQEAVVPKQTVVLFRWEYYMIGRACAWTMGFDARTVIDGQSAYHELKRLLEQSISPGTLSIDNEKIPISVGLFGPNRISAAALSDAMPDVEEFSTREQSIWRSALLRTSSRPVDMVFSIMSMFGVTLDPGSFDSSDRLGATISLAQEILRKGRPASWIGAGYLLEPSFEISTFPRFPETSVSGQAYVQMPDGTQKLLVDMCSSMNPSEYLDDIPGGSMDDDGYLKIDVHAAQIWKVQKNLVGQTLNVIRGQDGSAWQLSPLGDSESGVISSSEPTTYIVYIGQITQSRSVAYARIMFRDSLRVLVVQEHFPNKFHRLTFAKLSKDKWKEYLISLPKINLAIGGPNSPSNSSTKLSQRPGLTR